MPVRKIVKKPVKQSKYYTIVKYASTGVKALSMAKQALQAIQYIRGMINTELHKYEVNTSSQNVPYVGTAINYASFVNMAVGDTQETRTGNSILLKYILITGLLRNANSNPAPICRVRIMVLEDTQSVVDNTTSYNSSQILEYSNSANAITSPLSSDYEGRFKVLANRVFNMDTVNKVQHSFRYYIPMRGKHVKYNGTASTDIQKRNVFYLIFGDNDPSTGSMYASPTYNIQTRTAFYDN